ncbi:hypothetical protein [Mucilaginibacter ginsenosidivorans]|uniref:DUF4843 domain-containing protein n=1 Tax=Mucilaginibacter ginsenosidivorans TaxID=398053 RepID=A0A5B8UV55_9SPHI|nr:hypothetical protein [Mucilaginibacter ginsenosidivorans]QEC62802.1 hypothetical protein FRZ54_09475 [Mucilaginibacter ginsenosidivorans]
MKRILTIVCSAVMLLSVSSCTKKYITPNPNFSVFATVQPSDWLLSDDGKSYNASINVADITSDAASYDGVIVAISYADEVYEQIPEVYGGTSFSYTYNSGNGSQPGNLSIYAQSPDGTTPIQPTNAIKVKITLIGTN